MKTILIALLICLIRCPDGKGQNAGFRDWNAGLKLGFEGYLLPALEFHYRNMSLEAALYLFYQRLGFSLRFLPFRIKDKVQVYLTGKIAAEKFNRNYYMTFGGNIYYYHRLDVIGASVLGGPEIYFLKRFSAQALAGTGLSKVLNDDINGDLEFKASIRLAISLSVQVKLFHNFNQ